MKKWNVLTIMMIFALYSFGFVSCGSDDREDSLGGGVAEEIVGTWVGTCDKGEMTMTFNQDRTGEGERKGYFSSGDLMYVVEYVFTWELKGNTVNVKGRSVQTGAESGDVEEGTYSHQFEYNGLTLTIHEGAYGRITTFNKKENTIVAVDLGLPSGTKWANMNIGAGEPHHYGDYFAWGETTPKSVYNYYTYKWCDNIAGPIAKMTKYNFEPDYGFVDRKKVLEAVDDAATVNWGGKWRMPTYSEIDELSDNCTWTWAKKNGIDGFIVEGKNGRTIFLPAAGYYKSEKLEEAGKSCKYWSSTLGSDYCATATIISYGEQELDYGISHKDEEYARWWGLTIRPVQ